MDKNAIKEVTKKHQGIKYIFPIGVLAENVETDAEHRFVTELEKEKINKIETIEQSFRDGCNTLVSACTTYGATPTSNSPSDISTAIEKIYNDRYNKGREQGRKDVIADPSEYGIDQIRDIYEHEIYIQAFDDVTHMETTMEFWGSFSNSDTIQYQVPLVSNKMLYAITFDLEYYAIKGYDSRCVVSYEYSVETVEGMVIQSDSITPVTTGSSDNLGTVNANILVDLLQKNFSTVHDSLVLKLAYSMEGQITSSQEQIAQANISYTNIQARYK